MEKGTAAPLAVALQQQLKGNVMARHINRGLTFVSFQCSYYRRKKLPSFGVWASWEMAIPSEK